MTDRELLQQVLDAWQDHWVNDNQSALLETIRANCANCARCGEKNPAEIHTCTPMVRITTPEDIAKIKSKWVGLTDDEIAQLMFKCDVIVTGPTQFNFANAIEAKLKEKNT